MKKLLFLFLCLAAAGFVSACAVRPPGAPVPEMPGYGVHEAAVAPDTVSAVETPFRGFPGRGLAVTDLIVIGLPARSVLGTAVESLAAPEVPADGADYPLRL
jgi:hypothetical protein